MAGWKKIPITSLDHQVPEMQAALTRINVRRQILGSEACGDAVAKRWASRQLPNLEPAMQAMIATTDFTHLSAEELGEKFADFLESLTLPNLDQIRYVTQLLHQGNLDAIEKAREGVAKNPLMGEVALKRREEKWSEILIPKLLETDTPIGIAVGAAHLPGKDALVERFARAGLKVELISPTPQSRL